MRERSLSAIAGALWALASCAPVPDLRAVAAPDLRPPAVEAYGRLRRMRSSSFSTRRPSSLPTESGSIPRSPCGKCLPRVRRSWSGSANRYPERNTPSRRPSKTPAGIPSRSSPISLGIIRGCPPSSLTSSLREARAVDRTSRNEGSRRRGYGRSGSLSGSFRKLGRPHHFPEFRRPRGDFILVHFKSGGNEEEVDEPGDKKASKGYGASENAFDFWLPDSQGISGIMEYCRCTTGRAANRWMRFSTATAAPPPIRRIRIRERKDAPARGTNRERGCVENRRRRRAS